MTLTIRTTGQNSPCFELGGKPISAKQGVALLKAETGFTHADLARQCGVARKTSEGWIQGHKPSDGAVFKMAHLLTAHRTLNGVGAK